MSWLTTVRRRIGRVPGVRRLYGLGAQAKFAIDMTRAVRRDRAWRPAMPRPAGKLNAVMLSFARPRNIQPIAESVLRCDFVERLAILNNEPRVRLEDHIRLDSPRATILHATTQGLPVRRFELARELPGEYFMAIDDDTLLRAEQIEALFHRLIADPSVPHGVIGQVFDSPPDPQSLPSYRLLERRAGAVDVLNRVYFFTAAHLARFFSLLGEIEGLAPQRRPLRYADDLVLSFSGSNPPRIHDVGKVVYFPSSDDPAIACWLQPGFHEYRRSVYRDLLVATGRYASDCGNDS